MQVSDDMMELAKVWSDFKGNKHTIRNDHTKWLASNLAEIAFAKKYPDAIRISDTDYNADFILKNKRIDVKTKETIYKIKPDFQVAIEARQIDYRVDWYAFYSYNPKLEQIFFLGWKSKQDYIEESYLVKKGELDKLNNWIALKDCYNLKVSKLLK
jgi:hypothetical protein